MNAILCSIGSVLKSVLPAQHRADEVPPEPEEEKLPTSIWSFTENMRVLGDGESILQLRQWHRNVFAERCRLANVRPPDESTMNAWWPDTVAHFA